MKNLAIAHGIKRVLRFSARSACDEEMRRSTNLNARRQSPVAEVVRAHDVVHGRWRPVDCMAWRAKAAVPDIGLMAQVVPFSNYFGLEIYLFNFELLFNL
jgi:hypothetical protein